ncbi:SGNH/GDSL hydrolase family protein [Bacillus kexueae]|uniref:SGNH/GDSL hydrolase family protein n=1 Tax=Aeribacillus kexueae TaxID=2078952 RepID=UPI001FB04919|nr:SGNH/GDSL hydrolase family protein [Bacillus kexueae]
MKVWKALTITSALATSLCIAGFGVMVYDQFLVRESNISSLIKEKEEETNVKKDSSHLHIVALGDSLTRGIGDEDGKGYVGFAVDELKQRTEREINVSNLAIRGLRSEELIQQLKESEVKRQIAQADVIMMTIGGNDLFQSGNILRDLSKEQISSTQDKFTENLHAIFQSIRSVNKTAVIYYVSLYNPFSEILEKETTTNIVREWNFHSANVVSSYDNIIAVPTYDIFELHLEDYLYTDQFHPNGNGYKLMGERVASLITFKEEAEGSE